MSDHAAQADRRVIIADDEALARERLGQLLRSRPGYRIVSECDNGRDAVDAILAHDPDIVLLDIKMPELDGLEVAEALGERATALIFVTAYEEFALRAFDLSAVDYLLKPVAGPQLERALSRAESRLRQPDGLFPYEQMRALLSRLATAPTYLSRFLVRSRDDLFFVRAADVAWIDAQGNYVRVHAAGKAYLIRETMRAVEARLDPETFIRIHRSAIVNIDHVARFAPYQHGEYTVVLRDGTRLTTSRAHGARLRDLLR